MKITTIKDIGSFPDFAVEFVLNVNVTIIPKAAVVNCANQYYDTLGSVDDAMRYAMTVLVFETS